MSTLGINLLPKEKATPQQKEFFSKFGKILLIGFLVYILVVVILFVSAFYLKNQSQKIASEISQTEAKIKEAKKKEMQATGLKLRTEEVKNFLSSRFEISPIMDDLWQQIPAGTNLTLLEIKNKTILVSGTSKNAINVNDFLSNIKKQQTFNNVSLGSLSRLKNGEYNFSLELGGLNEKSGQ
jgi:Tfp pilus assembly protein PilN